MSTPRTPSNTTGPATKPKWSLVGAVITAGAIAVGAMATATAPAAHAKPISEKTIKSECKSAGGTYATSNGLSSCKYKGIDGGTYVDSYIDGEYTDTSGPW